MTHGPWLTHTWSMPDPYDHGWYIHHQYDPCMTHRWPMHDPYDPCLIQMTHGWPYITNMTHTRPWLTHIIMTHGWSICDTYDLRLTHYMTHIWVIWVIHGSYICHVGHIWLTLGQTWVKWVKPWSYMSHMYGSNGSWPFAILVMYGSTMGWVIWIIHGSYGSCMDQRWVIHGSYWWSMYQPWVIWVMYGSRPCAIYMVTVHTWVNHGPTMVIHGSHMGQQWVICGQIWVIHVSAMGQLVMYGSTMCHICVDHGSTRLDHMWVIWVMYRSAMGHTIHGSCGSTMSSQTSEHSDNCMPTDKWSLGLVTMIPQNEGSVLYYRLLWSYILPVNDLPPPALRPTMSLVKYLSPFSHR